MSAILTKHRTLEDNLSETCKKNILDFEFGEKVKNTGVVSLALETRGGKSQDFADYVKNIPEGIFVKRVEDPTGFKDKGLYTENPLHSQVLFSSKKCILKRQIG